MTSAPAASALRRALPAAVLVAAILAVYAGSFRGPFLFDDTSAILTNRSIRHLWPLGPVLDPPLHAGETGAGRPLLNLSFAVNYALGGTNVAGYHAVNLAIHILAALALFGIIRRTIGPRIGFAAALLWALHPVQTESVAYMAQRAESLMGLFYLLTLYCFIRYAKVERVVPDALGRPDGRPSASGTTRSTLGWAFLAFAACLCGMATKEVMATAPLIVLLYDRTFIAGSFAEAWRRRRAVHLSLAGTWLLLAVLVRANHGRGASAGFGLGVSPWSYALTQCRALVLYLKLSLWPRPLVLDYGNGVVAGFSQVVPQAMLLAGLAAATVWGIVRRPAFGFLGAWFLVILAPSSSFLPVVTQTMAEHRLYLSLAAIAVLAALGLGRLPARFALAALVALAAVLGVATARRVQDYRSKTVMWNDVARKAPGNPRAYYNLGLIYGLAGERDKAMAEYEKAVSLRPSYAQARNNLALELALTSDRREEAMAQFEQALRFKPDSAAIHSNFAHVLARIPGKETRAIEEYEEALRLQPDDAESHNDLGNLLVRAGRRSEARAHYAAAVRCQPDFAAAHNNLAMIDGADGHLTAAIAEFEDSLRLAPDNPEGQNNLAVLYAETGRLDAAIAHVQAALRLRPSYAAAQRNLRLFQAERRP